MTDEELIDTWTTLEPTLDQRQRIDARISEWLDAHDTSIAAEWLGLVKVSPIRSLALAAASIVAIAALTPLVWFAGALTGMVP